MESIATAAGVHGMKIRESLQKQLDRLEDECDEMDAWLESRTQYGANQVTEHLEAPEKIILAGDMALHFGLCLASTHVGVIASMHYDLGSKSAHRHDTDAQRVMVAMQQVCAFVDQHVDSIDDAIYEQPTPNSNRGAQTQAEMITAFKLAVYQLGATMAVNDKVYPSTLKKWAAGHGAAEKWQMVEAANLFADYATPIVDDNEADAVCLAAWYAERVKDRELRRLARKMQRETEASKA